MLSRRMILRALGFGAPASAVAVAVGLPTLASGGFAGVTMVEGAPLYDWRKDSTVGGSGAIGEVRVGSISVRAGDLKPDTVINFDGGVLSFHS